MSEQDNDIVERLLREHFEGPVPDDGFCDRTMPLLPSRRRLQAWPLALGVTIGGALCWLSLLSAPLVRTGWRDGLSGIWSAQAVILMAVMAGASLLALAWTATEAEGRSQDGAM